MIPLKLNLGAGDKGLSGFLSVDRVPPADVICDLRERWPWGDSEVDEVHAAHIFEHLPDRIHTMNELHRILRPGGQATIIVPSAAKGEGFAQDPTHVSQWCVNSFLYYWEHAPHWKGLHRRYDITARFRLTQKPTEFEETHIWNKVTIVTAILEAVK